MKHGIYKHDNQKLTSIEKNISYIIDNKLPHHHICDVIPDLETLRTKASNGKTPLWLLARHSDRCPDLLKTILEKYVDEITLDDLNIEVTEGPFKGTTAKWLMEIAPYEHNNEFQQFISKLLQLEFGISYRPILNRYYLDSLSGPKLEYDDMNSASDDNESLGDLYTPMRSKVSPY